MQHRNPFKIPKRLRGELSVLRKYGRGWFTSGILSLLDSLSPRLEGRKDDLQFLQALVESKEFHSLIKVSYQPTLGGTSTLSLTPLSLHIIPI